MMKSYFLSALLFCGAALSAAAQDGKVEVLMMDGSSHVVQLSQVAKLEVSGDDMKLVGSDGNAVATHKIADVSRINLTPSTTAIASVNGKGNATVTLRTDGYTVTADGLADNAALEVYTAGGALVAKAVARDGKASIDLSAAAAGAYVVKAGGKSLKMVKR